MTDFTDRTTCILFGDAAGAVIVECSEENDLLETITETNGEFGKDLYLTSQKNSINDEEVVANNKLHQMVELYISGLSKHYPMGYNLLHERIVCR